MLSLALVLYVIRRACLTIATHDSRYNILTLVLLDTWVHQLTQQYNVNVRLGMYVIRLTCATIATRIPANTLTLFCSIWAADPNTVTLYGYQMLM